MVLAAIVALGVTLRSSTMKPGQTVASTQPARAMHMREHFSEVLVVHDAVIRGDLTATREPATWLAGHQAPAPMPAEAAPFVADMQRAARRTAQATTVLEAALGTADMLKTCGDCHRRLGVGPAMAEAASPPEVEGIVGHMLEHQQAADRLLQGLIVPSAALWRAGLAGFRTAPLRSRALSHDRKVAAQLADAERRIHDLAAMAGRAEDRGARAVFYGQLIARCADCHSLHRAVQRPSQR